MKKIAGKIGHEFRELLPPTIFFFVAFHILVFSKALMLKSYGVSVSAVAGATVGALLVGKAVLLADMLPWVNRFPDKPLIYNIFWKTMIYNVAALVVRYAEHLIEAWWKVGDFVAANRHMRDEIIWPHFWALQLWLVVLLTQYCVARELIRAIGVDKVKRMLFKEPPGVRE